MFLSAIRSVVKWIGIIAGIIGVGLSLILYLALLMSGFFPLLPGDYFHQCFMAQFECMGVMFAAAGVYDSLGSSTAREADSYDLSDQEK